MELSLASAPSKTIAKKNRPDNPVPEHAGDTDNNVAQQHAGEELEEASYLEQHPGILCDFIFEASQRRAATARPPDRRGLRQPNGGG